MLVAGFTGGMIAGPQGAAVGAYIGYGYTLANMYSDRYVIDEIMRLF